MRLLLSQEALTVRGIKQMYVDCDSKEGRDAQYDTLVQLYGLATIGQSIIFVKVYISLAFLLNLTHNAIDACDRR